MRVSPDRDKARGALLGLACGDALGAGFEGTADVSPDWLARHEAGGGALTYTDDTAMTIVLAEHLLGPGARDAAGDEDRLARAFADAWRAEPWRGYGPGPPRVFRGLLAGASWRELVHDLYRGEGSFGNGGAMRVAPVGLVTSDLGAVARLARGTASVTHAHPLGQEGAVIQAAAVALAYLSDPARPLDRTAFLYASLSEVAGDARDVYEEKLRAVAAILDAAGTDDTAVTDVARALGNGVAAPESVPAAHLAFLLHPDDPAATVRFAIGLGGDTDTIAAMAGAVAGARCGERALPAHWLDRLEGLDRLRGLADSLVAGSR